MNQNDIVALLKERAEAVQTVVSQVAELSEVFRYAVEITKKQGGAAIAAPGLGRQMLGELKELCRESGFSLLMEDLRDHVGTIHTGLTLVDWAIAETATLVMDSSKEDIRIATMLSETHVALLPRSRIRPDSMSLESELNQLMKFSPRYLAFISGASRTADIERVLTIGVHGPKELHILIVEDDSL